MKVTGIICEYNPLHNGHVYHFNQIRNSGTDAIVAVMSGNFVQHGDVAILDKFTRANIAIKAGADLVIELPVSYALAPGENFALGGVAILTGLGVVNEISFGSECGDIRLLTRVAEACRTVKRDYRDLVEELLRAGNPYPEVMSQIVGELAGPEAEAVLRQPNNTLAISYINAIAQLNSPIRPVTITRHGAGHHATRPTENGTSTSSSYIRHYFMEGGDCRHLMPGFAWKALYDAGESGRTAAMKQLERLILYKLRTTDPDDMHDIAEIGQGLEYRLYQAKRADSLEELLYMLRTKRYTSSRLRRVLLHLLLDIHTEDMQSRPAYGRILAMNDTGKKVLHEAKRVQTIPFSTSLAELAQAGTRAGRCAALESQATDIYQLACPVIGKGESDFRRRFQPENSSHRRDEKK